MSKNDYVMTWAQFKLYEELSQQAQASLTEEDFTQIRTIVERLLIGEGTGLIATGKTKNQAGKESAEDDSFSTEILGELDLDTLYRMNGGSIQKPPKSIDKFLMTQDPEPFTSEEYSSEKEQAKRQAMTADAESWMIDNNPEATAQYDSLVAKFNTANDGEITTAAELERAGKNPKGVPAELAESMRIAKDRKLVANADLQAYSRLVYIVSKIPDFFTAKEGEEYSFQDKLIGKLEYMADQAREQYPNAKDGQPSKEVKNITARIIGIENIFGNPSHSSASNAKIKAIVEFYLEDTDPNAYALYERYSELISTIPTAVPIDPARGKENADAELNDLVQCYMDIHKLDESACLKKVQYAIDKNSVESLRTKLMEEAEDKKDGLLMLSEFKMSSKLLSDKESEEKVMQAVKQRKELEKRISNLAQITKEQANGMSDDKLVKKLVRGGNMLQDDAVNMVKKNIDIARKKVAKILANTETYKPVKRGRIYFRSKENNAYAAANNTITLNWPVFVDYDDKAGNAVPKLEWIKYQVQLPNYAFDKSKYKGMSEEEIKEMKKKDAATQRVKYNSNDGEIIFPEAKNPFPIPQNSAAGKEMLGKKLLPTYSIRKSDNRTGLDKPFLKTRTVDEEVKLEFNPEKGVPTSVTVIVNWHDWNAFAEDFVISNAPKAQQFFTASSADTVTKEEVSNQLKKLDAEGLAKKYSEVFKGDEPMPALLAGLDPANDNMNRPDKTAKKRRAEMENEIISALTGRPDKFMVTLEVEAKSAATGKPTLSTNAWVRFSIDVDMMEERTKDVTSYLNSKTYLASKNVEVHTPLYRHVLANVTEIANDNVNGNKKLAQMYSELTGKSEEESADQMNKGRQKFIEDVAWLKYADEVDDEYAETFNVSKEVASELLKTKRAENLGKLDREMNSIERRKIKSGEAEPDTAAEPKIKDTSIDPITLRRQIELAMGVRGSDLKKANAASEEPTSGFITGDEAKKLLSDPSRTDQEIADIYSDVYPEIKDKKTILARVIKNRASMINDIADSIDDEAAERATTQKPSARYNKILPDNKLIDQYYLLAMNEFSVMREDDEEEMRSKYEEYVPGGESYDSLDGESVVDITAKAKAKAMSDKLAKNRQYAVKSLVNALRDAGMNVYAVSDEELAKEYAELNKIKYATALELVSSDRPHVVREMDDMLYKGPAVSKYAEVERKIEDNTAKKKREAEEQAKPDERDKKEYTGKDRTPEDFEKKPELTPEDIAANKKREEEATRMNDAVQRLTKKRKEEEAAKNTK